MPQDLPDDILLELVEVHLSDASDAQLRDALCNLSLTSRRFRSFAIRVLYRSLSFRIDLRIRIHKHQARMVSMIRHYLRAKHLIRSRHLLRNVRRLSLYHWDGTFGAIPGLRVVYHNVADADADPMADDVKKLVEVIYEALTRLVPHMPGLRELTLVGCVITPFLYAAMSACPLNLLHVYTDSPADPIDIPTDLPQKLHITNLHYGIARRTWEDSVDGKLKDPFATRILEHSISSLKELSVNSGLLSTFASHISNKILPLQYLSASFFPSHGCGILAARWWQSDAACSLWGILLASPQLRGLIIKGTFPEIPPSQDLKYYILPNLVDVYASPYVLQLLQAQGRSLQRVRMSQVSDADEQQITQLTKCLPVHLRQFSVSSVRVETVRALLDFIQSFSTIKSLETLNIPYSMDPIHWLDYDDTQELSDTVTKSLQDLAHLHTCHIWNMADPDYHKGFHPLIDPRSMGHPSLEVLGVDFCTGSVWHKDVEVGWVLRGWERRRGRYWYDI